jgi:hypothetical protein
MQNKHCVRKMQMLLNCKSAGTVDTTLPYKVKGGDVSGFFCVFLLSTGTTGETKLIQRIVLTAG